MRVRCEVEGIELDGDCDGPDGFGVSVPSVCATCGRCGHQVESYGTSDASVRRCLVVMRQECPRGESNFYAGPPDDGND